LAETLNLEVVETGNYEMDDSTKRSIKETTCGLEKDGDKWKIFRTFGIAALCPRYEINSGQYETTTLYMDAIAPAARPAHGPNGVEGLPQAMLATPSARRPTSGQGLSP